MARMSPRRLGSFAAGFGLFLTFIAFSVGTSGLGLWVVGVAVAGIGAGFWVWDSFRVRAHRAEFRQFALSHGWKYAPYGTSYTTRFAGFPFHTGERRRQEDILTGTYNSLTCSTFTHLFQTQASRDSPPVEQDYQVTLVELDVHLPRLDIVPESLGNRLAQALGGVDVEMESYDFNRRWRVKSADRKYAMDVIDPRMMERLMAYDFDGAAIRIEGGAVMMWSAGRVGVSDLARRLDLLVSVATRIPAHVTRRFTELGYGIGPAADDAPVTGPAWATQGGVLNSRRYTGIGTEGDGADDARGGR